VIFGLIDIPVTGLGEAGMMFVAEGQEEPMPVRKYRPIDIALVIAVRFAPNISSVLKKVVEVKVNVILVLKAVDSMLLLNAILG
jgi:hypothetical protein